MNLRSTLLKAAFGVAVGTGVLWDCCPLTTDAARLDDVPLRGPGYAMTDLPLTDSEAERYENVHTRKRLLICRGHAVIMTMIDGSQDRHAVHDPTYCLRGDGWRIEHTGTLQVDHGEQVSHLRVSRDGVTREAVYWFTDGQKAFPSIMEYWWKCSARRMSFGWSGDEPVFVLMQPANDAPVHWRRILESVPAILVR